MKNKLISIFLLISFIIATVSVVKAFDSNVSAQNSLSKKNYLTKKVNVIDNNSEWVEKT